MDPLISSHVSREALAVLSAVDAFNGLPEPALRNLEQELELVRLMPGQTLFRRGDPGNCLYVIVSGSLHVILDRPDGEEQVLALLASGDCLGEMAIMTGQPRSATVRALEGSALLKLPKPAFERLAAEHPTVKSRMLHLAARRQSGRQLALTDLFRGLDKSVIQEFVRESNWVRLPGGETLFRQGDAADSLYAVVHGRLQVLIQPDHGGRPIIRQIGRGTCVGETALLTGERHSATVRAVRDSELVRLRKKEFTSLLDRHPEAATELARTLARRLRQSTSSTDTACHVATIAVIPGHPAVAQSRFAERLVEALEKLGGSVLHLSSSRIDRYLGEGTAHVPFASAGNGRIVNWLNDQEEQYRHLVYECDLVPSTWTQRCLRQADLILIVHPAEAEPGPGEIERRLATGELSASAARRQLVLLHQDETIRPTGTRRWLEACPVETHHHVRVRREADYERLARLATGRAVSLVLSGGGARGFAHIGVIRALGECGLPIDLVGGTSMGSIIAGQYAMGYDAAAMIEINRKGFVDLKPHRDKTVPIVSLITARKLVRMLAMMFDEIQIEDLWLRYFCVSSNLTRAEIVVHQDGPLWLWARASISVPGVTPPVLHNGDLLVDGGVLNNLPADVVGQLCQGSVIAVDAAPRIDLSANTQAPPSLSGWYLLWDRLNPFGERLAIPNIFSILTRAAMLSTLSNTEMLKREADLYIHPPTEEIGMFDWKAIDRAVDIGYRFALTQIEAWKKTRTT